MSATRRRAPSASRRTDAGSREALRTYVVELQQELTRIPTAEDSDRVMKALAHYHPSVAVSPASTLEVTITVPALSLAAAVDTALALFQAKVGQALSVRAVPQELRDTHRESTAVEELVGVSRAAEMLGVTRRRVLQMIYEGKLPNRKIGREYAIPCSAIHAIARR